MHRPEKMGLAAAVLNRLYDRVSDLAVVGGGGRGIRTLDTFPYTRFPSVRTRPDYATPPEDGMVEVGSPVPNYTQATIAAAMGEALSEAAAAAVHGDVPVGAVLLDASGAVVASNHNRREELGDATAHAEMLVLSERSKSLGQWRLEGHTLVVTLEPCAMCAMAAVWARVDRIVYGAADLKAGAVWSLFNIPQDERLNHFVEVVAGVKEQECRLLLESFFGSRRPA